MDVATFMAYGADVGTMLAGVAILGGVGAWVRQQQRDRRDAKEVRRHRTWYGYIPVEGLDTWDVRVIEPEGPSTIVTLEVLNGPDGEPSVNITYNMRIVAERDGKVSRSPTEDEYEFLVDLRRERGYGKGYPVRQDNSRY
jgi:hypothetical protein